MELLLFFIFTASVIFYGFELDLKKTFLNDMENIEKMFS
jgi:hypothetical protein